MNQLKTSFMIFTTMVVLLWTSLLRAQTFDENVLIVSPVSHDLYTAGHHIEVQSEIAGDLIVAGQMISINSIVDGDIIAAGETINLQAAVSDDVRVAGRQIIISNHIADHIVAAGETVTLEQDSRIGSWAWLAGDTVRISGYIDQELKVAARRVIISGEIKGDVELFAEQIDILDSARIHGNLIWHSKHQPTIESGGQINGQLIEKPWEHPEHNGGSPFAGLAFITLSLMFSGIVIYLLFPALPLQASRSVQQRPLLSLSAGLGVLLITPVVIAVLFVTAIGSLLAFALLASYLVMILLGVTCALFSLGHMGLQLTGKHEKAGKGLRILAFVLALIAIGLLQLIPFIGSLIYLAVILFGLGGLTLAIYRNRQAV
ncbi:hypothetical protein C942_04209 [Photobacterium marinum]|uniref:DUF8173 domain-containing protein n=1 Tax=Photobacterium marinum TaxID=1056511 RepID=L8JCF3_9GAMM|nr:polymer-forming cytoskeletal protein [Photobacterium marinum]ELR66511.1 hypothetical protein C942_04209 [Photobacterium marinum]